MEGRRHEDGVERRSPIRECHPLDANQSRNFCSVMADALLRNIVRAFALTSHAQTLVARITPDSQRLPLISCSKRCRLFAMLWQSLWAFGHPFSFLLFDADIKQSSDGLLVLLRTAVGKGNGSGFLLHHCSWLLDTILFACGLQNVLFCKMCISV